MYISIILRALLQSDRPVSNIPDIIYLDTDELVYAGRCRTVFVVFFFN